MTAVRTDDDTCAAYHHEPDGTELFTLGWCHGPPGLGWLFRQLELTTGEAWPAETWLRRAARGDLLSGIAGTPGARVLGQRCPLLRLGRSGRVFLDLHRLEGLSGGPGVRRDPRRRHP